jgi:hypothetical protein
VLVYTEDRMAILTARTLDLLDLLLSEAGEG